MGVYMTALKKDVHIFLKENIFTSQTAILWNSNKWINLFCLLGVWVILRWHCINIYHTLRYTCCYSDD